MSHEKRFLGSKYPQNAFAAGLLLMAAPRPLAGEGKGGKGKE